MSPGLPRIRVRPRWSTWSLASANVSQHPQGGITLGFFPLVKKFLSPPRVRHTPPKSDHVSQVQRFFALPLPRSVRSPFLSALGGRKILYLRPIPLMWSRARARAPTRALSLYVIGHLDLCTVTGSFADLLPEEAEAARPSQSCFVRGILAVPLLAAPPLLSNPAFPRPHRRTLVGRQPRSARRSHLNSRAPGTEAARVPSVLPFSLSSPTPNAPLLYPPCLIGRPEAERLSGGPIRARFPTGSLGPAHEAASPGTLTAPIGRPRAGPSAAWRSSAAAVGRAALQHRYRLGPRSPGIPVFPHCPRRRNPGRASRVSTAALRALAGRSHSQVPR